MIVVGELGQKLDVYLSRITSFGFAGAALAAKEGQMVLNKGYGLANRAEGVPNTAQTVFSLGSITKQFTAAAIMKLAMQGKLHTDDVISCFFPSVPADKAAITLHQLLTHTAGLRSDTGDDYAMADKEETILKILQSELIFLPGTDYDYSNAGYTLLAAVVEQVAQRPYEQFLQEALFAPAGMRHTGYRLPDWSGVNVAHWHNGRSDFGTPLEKAYPSWNLMGNGDMLSTTEDMFRWHQALLGSDILSEAAKAQMYTSELRDYAYGWRVIETANGRCLQHNGASSYGSSALFRRWVEADVVLMLFANTDYNGEVMIRPLEGPLEALIFGEAVPLPPQAMPGSLARFTGTFALPDGATLELVEENAALHFSPQSQAGVNWLLGLDKGETAVYHQIHAQTQTIMAAALAGDLEPLLASLNDRARRAPGVCRAWETLVDAVQPTEMHVLGVRPSLYLENACEALTQFSGPAGNLCLVSIWRDGQNVGVLLTELGGGMGFTAVAQPIAPDTLATYHLATTKTRQFQIVREGDAIGDKITGLVSEQTILARKI